MCTNSNLPFEVISAILRYIDNQQTVFELALLNRHYYRATQPHLYRCPRPDNFKRLLACLHASPTSFSDYIRTLQFGCDETIETITGLLQQTRYLIEVRFMTTWTLTDATFITIAPLLTHLNSLTLCNVTLTHLIPLTSTRLSTLILISCPDLTPTTFSKLALPCLTHLAVYDCHWLTATETARDITRFDQLTTLTLEDCGRTDGAFLHRLSLPRLTSFSFVGDVGFQWSYQSNVNDAVVTPFIASHPDLHTLKLKFCTIDDSTLGTIARCLPHLQVLSLEGCVGLAPRAVRDMIIACPRLITLDLSGAKVSAQWFPETRGGGRFLNVLSCLDQIRAHPHFILSGEDRWHLWALQQDQHMRQQHQHMSLDS
ncbi:hypothetical protein BC941DRAFT_168878 [Chlamydoabsidia padenii]|nr:hypothetical protein BC941DRAFT_168878 [Chlamydoabsidia padenii]